MIRAKNNEQKEYKDYKVHFPPGCFGVELLEITDEMLYAQRGKKYLWELSPDEKDEQDKAKLFSMWEFCKKVYGKDSLDAREALNKIPKEQRGSYTPKRRIVKAPRKVHAYTFILHARDGTLTQQAYILLVQQLLSKNLQDRLADIVYKTDKL